MLADGAQQRREGALAVDHDGLCAIKRPRRLRQKSGVELPAYREMTLLRGLTHPCVVGLLGVFLDPKPEQGSSRKLNLVLEYVEGGDLAQRIKALHESGGTPRHMAAPVWQRSVAASYSARSEALAG